MIKVVERPDLSLKGEKRYVLVETETGKIVEDCQGWGAKKIKGLWACYYHKKKRKASVKEEPITDFYDVQEVIKDCIHNIEIELAFETAKEINRQRARTWIKLNKAWVTEYQKKEFDALVAGEKLPAIQAIVEVLPPNIPVEFVARMIRKEVVDQFNKIAATLNRPLINVGRSFLGRE